MATRYIERVYVVRLTDDGSYHVDVTGPLSWFDTIERMAAYFGPCVAIDDHGRDFARALDVGNGRVDVRMTRGDVQRVRKKPVDLGAEITPAAAIELASHYSWRRGAFPRAERAALHEWLETKMLPHTWA